ncbi:MAG: hypothetical protein HQL38_00600 [Alphaproteobacteria bacterium]|nr:hypothetical protein [Alphaproteobacteria bacterium]MBF0391153.1 hypothetical protein [Alphaproteobacteria bacterium]
MTYADIAAQALREAAQFYRMVGEQNPEVNENLSRAATAFEAIADQLDIDPEAAIPGGGSGLQ